MAILTKLNDSLVNQSSQPKFIPVILLSNDNISMYYKTNYILTIIAPPNIGDIKVILDEDRFDVSFLSDNTINIYAKYEEDFSNNPYSGIGIININPNRYYFGTSVEFNITAKRDPDEITEYQWL